MLWIILYPQKIRSSLHHYLKVTFSQSLDMRLLGVKPHCCGQTLSPTGLGTVYKDSPGETDAQGKQWEH